MIADHVAADALVFLQAALTHVAERHGDTTALASIGKLTAEDASSIVVGALRNGCLKCSLTTSLAVMRLDVPLAVLTPHRNNQLKLLGLGFTSAPRQSQSFALEEPLEPDSFAFPTTGGCTGFDQSARFAVFAAVQQQLGLKPELDAAAMEGRLERMRAARGGLGGARQRPALASCGLGSLSAVPATFECGPQGPPRS